MRFGLFGSASARRGSGEFDSTEGYHDFIEYNVEAEALGFHSTFCVEHHFTGYGQVSATLNLLTWLGARTKTLRLRSSIRTTPCTMQWVRFSATAPQGCSARCSTRPARFSCR